MYKYDYIVGGLKHDVLKFCKTLTIFSFAFMANAKPAGNVKPLFVLKCINLCFSIVLTSLFFRVCSIAVADWVDIRLNQKSFIVFHQRKSFSLALCLPLAVNVMLNLSYLIRGRGGGGREMYVNDIDFSCVCPVIDNEFRHKIGKVVCKSMTAYTTFDEMLA